MFSLFGKKNFFVGVDFGTSAIKIVELSFKNQRTYLENYGWVDLGFVPSIMNDGESKPDYNQKLSEYLKLLVAQIKLKGKSVFASLPGFSGLITIVEFPNMKEKELEEAIQFEARKYIPVSLEEVALDWEVVNKNENLDFKKLMTGKKEAPSNKIQVLLVAASKKDIKDCSTVITGAELKINSIELETFSIARSLVGDDLGTFLIVDIGARATNIVLVEKGVIRVNRNVDLGGNEISNVIADSLKISFQRAESMKKEKKDILNSREMSIVIPALEMVSNEAKRIIVAYKERNPEGRLDGIILSGGTAKLSGIDQYFTKMLGAKAYIGNPWRKVFYDQNLDPVIKNIGTSFSVALGLAMRGIEEYKRK